MKKIFKRKLVLIILLFLLTILLATVCSLFFNKIVFANTYEQTSSEKQTLAYINMQDLNKKITFQIDFYVDGEIKKTQVIIRSVKQSDADEISFDLEKKYADEFKGYKLVSNQSFPNKIQSGATVKLYYEKDVNQTKELSYQIQYYIDGTLKETKVISKQIWVNDPNKIEVTPIENYEDKYVGCTFIKTNYSAIPKVVSADETIKLYYETKEYDYQVEYYYNGVLDLSKTEKFFAKYGSIIDSYPDKSEKYQLLKTENFPLTITIEENIIKVYYKTEDALVLAMAIIFKSLFLTLTFIVMIGVIKDEVMTS